MDTRNDFPFLDSDNQDRIRRLLKMADRGTAVCIFVSGIAIGMGIGVYFFGG